MFAWPRHDKSVGFTAEDPDEAQQVDVGDLFLIPFPEQRDIGLMGQVDNLCTHNQCSTKGLYMAELSALTEASAVFF